MNWRRLRTQRLARFCRTRFCILIPSSNPDGIDIVANWYRKTLGTTYEGTGAARALSSLRRARRQSRLVHVEFEGDAARSPALFWQEWFPQIVYDVHQQGLKWLEVLHSAVFRSTESKHPAVIAAPGWTHRTQDRRRFAGRRLQRRHHKRDVRHLVARRLSHRALLSQLDRHPLRGRQREVDDPDYVTREQLKRASTRGMRNALEATTNLPDPWPGGDWRPRDIMDMEMIASRAVLSLAAKFRQRVLNKLLRIGKSSRRRRLKRMIRLRT